MSHRTPRAPARPTRGGFTLIELLVVVAVLGVLVAVLLPALGRAQENARLAQCLSQSRQITIAATDYSYDFDERWPFVPAKLDPEASFCPVAFNSWTHGGKSTSDYWSGLNEVTIDERPLNAYTNPDLLLEDKPDPQDKTQVIRTEVRLYQCPSDKGTYQRSFWNDGTFADLNISSYDDVGTSYHLNVKWWFDEYPGGCGPYLDPGSSKLDFVEASALLRNGGPRSPSHFVWSFEQNMDFVAHTGESREGDHGGMNKATAMFMDGHVSYLTIEPGEVDSLEYTLTLFESDQGPGPKKK